jgi:uncharacterized protein YcaQ
MPRAITLDDLRSYAVVRSLFEPTTLGRGIEKLGFVQADPIRAPARAQDLTLRHRVKGYRAGDLERRYAALEVEEDYLVNYGFLFRPHLDLMHPRTPRRRWNKLTEKRARTLLDFVRERGEVHPREVDERFQLGTVRNYWGGSSSATTHLLDGMHYRGLLRVARREGGVRVYAPRSAPEPSARPESPASRADALLRLIVAKYAPLPSPTLARLAGMLRHHAAPQLASELRASHERARRGLPHVRIDGVDWYWPDEGKGGAVPSAIHSPDDRVRLLAPFDPVVWDRARFALFWGWDYRFEAYTPAAKRKLGYYALPLLWRDRVIGWGNVSAIDGRMSMELGYVAGKAPRDRAFSRELEAERERMRAFLYGP